MTNKKQRKTPINSINISIFGNNKLFNFLYHHPEREVYSNEVDVSNLKTVFIKTSLVVLLIPILIFLIASWSTNTLSLEGEGVGFFEDYTLFFQIIIFELVLLFSYIFFEKFRKFFLKMLSIIDINSLGGENYHSYLKDKSELLNGQKKYKLYKSVIYGIGILGVFWWIFPFKKMVYTSLNLSLPLHENVWRIYEYSPLNAMVANLFYVFFLGFIFIPLIWRLLTSAWILNRFCKDFRTYIKLKPLHPDDVGGLSPLGEIALYFHFIILSPILLFIASLYVYGVTGSTYIGIIYFFILIFIFFLPLLSAHEVMQDHKTTVLHTLSDKYNLFANELESYIPKEKSTDKELEIMDKMEKLRSYYKDIQKMPVWPFNFAIMSRFVGSILIPFFFLIIERYI